MTQGDVLYRFRLRTMALAEEMGNDGQLAGRIVTLSTLLSGISIPVIMAIGL